MSDATIPRVREDRRRSHSSSPVEGIERRRNAERRLPEMAVIRLSGMDWQKYFGALLASPENAEHNKAQDPEALKQNRNDP
ncbi:MAG: hypothetical protein H6R14_241 [Proteobacteria bacterium]|nr:hypothetical protein [Pseudomonadota bacterium]